MKTLYEIRDHRGFLIFYQTAGDAQEALSIAKMTRPSAATATLVGSP